jgi:hypothetical protein
VCPPSGLNCFLAFFVVQALLTDGYISQTFQSRPAEQYFLSLLKSSSIPPHTTLSYTSRGGYFFFVNSVPSYIPAPFPNSPSRWLLDRGIMDGGTVVPQTMWSPYSVSDRRQHVEMGKLQMPVFFEGEDGALGFSLAASVDGQCHFRHADDPAPLSQKTTTHIRIIVSTALVFCAHLLNSHLFTNNISGLVIRSLSAKSQFVTSPLSVNPSQWLSFLVRSGEPWILSSGFVFEHSSLSSFNKSYFIGLRIGLRVCQRPGQTMADRARRHPAQRHPSHRCHSGFCWKLDADNATESLHFLICTMLRYCGDMFFGRGA